MGHRVRSNARNQLQPQKQQKTKPLTPSSTSFADGSTCASSHDLRPCSRTPLRDFCTNQANFLQTMPCHQSLYVPGLAGHDALGSFWQGAVAETPQGRPEEEVKRQGF